MTSPRVLVVSVALALAALGSAGAGVSMVSIGGRPYIDATSLAAYLGAQVESTPDRVYLRTGDRVISLTRGWARVEVDGKAVVLEAPVRVEQGQWLVPEVFMRQVVPLLAAGAPVARKGAVPGPAVPATQGRVPSPVVAASGPVPSPAAGASAPVPAPRVAASAPRAAAPGPAPAPAAVAPGSTARVAGPMPVPAPGIGASAPAGSLSSPLVTAPEASIQTVPRLAPGAASAAQSRDLPASKASEPEAVAMAPVRALEAPGAAPRSMVIESPQASAPAVARAIVPPVASPPAASKVAAVPTATIEDVRLRSYPAFTRVVVETSAMVRPRVEAVSPKELRIRLASVTASRRAEEVRDGILEAVHIEPAEGDAVVRVTFTGASHEPKTSVLSDPPRLLFDFPRTPEAGVRAPLSAPGPLRTLVLDAGHGGHDSGAVGPAGLMEKDLVLDVTRRVASLVAARLPGIKVLQSRKGDTFVALRERTTYANREGADLFVSIHANAHREMTSEGVETYFLSTEATDSAARQVAAAENSVVKLEKPVARSRADVVKAILWDLAQSEFQQESSRLAEVVQDSMTQSLKIPNRGVKQAGFYVLGGAAMPAILVEIGFVTNPREERRLKDSAYRDEIARAIFAGIAEYKQDLDRRAARAVSR
jgi:N-acetylmuramoyl-L-alanine amidase